MKRWQKESVCAVVRPVEDKYLRCRYYLDRSPVEITVGAGEEELSVLACKEIYAKGIKTALELEMDSCAFDLTAAAKLGAVGVAAAVEGVYGGAYRDKNCLTDAVEPALTCYACGEGWSDGELERGVNLARAIMRARNLVNTPANALTPAIFAEKLGEMARELPLEVQIYDKAELEELGLKAFLAVGSGSGNDPRMAVLRYTGDSGAAERLGYVGKGITFDTGGYSLKSSKSIQGMEGDMAGAAAVAAAMLAIAANGVKSNVTAVLPLCENRISNTSYLPMDVIGSLSGQTIRVISTDAEGRLILADGLTWAARKEGCTRLVDVATLTGAIVAMLGHVTTGVSSNDDDWYARLEAAAARSGERFWRMPDSREYESLIEDSLADVRNSSKDGCGALTAGLFLRKFTDNLPWVHLDIAGTSSCKKPVWQHQTVGATGCGAATLYHLAAGMAEQ